MSLSHRLALSDVLNSLQEHLFSLLSRQVRRVEFRLYETKGEFLPQEINKGVCATSPSPRSRKEQKDEAVFSSDGNRPINICKL